MNVLIATDLSEASLAALESVCACQSGVFDRATLLHVIDLDHYTGGGSIPQILEYANAMLHEWADRLRSCGLEAEVRVEQGPAAETIEDVEFEIQPDLVVMTNLGHGAAIGRVLGSTVEQVASRGRLPVLVERVLEREGRWCRSAGGSPFERILVAVDFDGALPSLLEHVRRLPGQRAVRVVHVAQTREEAADAEKDLAEAVVGKASDIAVLVGDPVESVVEEITSWDATVVVVAPCRHSAVHRAIRGSVARGIALRAPCSVLFVPAGRQSGAGQE